MRLLYYLKSNLKIMKSTLLIQIMYFIVFPLILAGVLTLTETIGKGEDIKLKETKVKVIDKDNTEMSGEIINLLKSEGVKDYILVDEEGKSELIIEEGYGDKVLKGEEGKISLKPGGRNDIIIMETLKGVLDKYHQNLYVAVSGGNIESEPLKFVKEEILESNLKEDAFKRSITSMIGFIITMYIYSLLQGQYTELGVNLEKRRSSLPIEKIKLYFYDVIVCIVQFAIILGVYIFVFRITGIAFTGNLIHIIGLIILTSIFVTGIGNCISSIFGKRVTKVLSTLFLLLFVVGTEAFGGIGKVVGITSITVPIEKLFLNYNSFGNLLGCGNIFLGILVMSVVLILIGGIRESLRKERIL
ncbi:MAG: ABC transporter permease [Clostridium sp.]